MCDWVESIIEELVVVCWYVISYLLLDGKFMIIMGGCNNFIYEFVLKRFLGEGVYFLEFFKILGYDNLYLFVNLFFDGNLFIFVIKDLIFFNFYIGEVF